MHKTPRTPSQLLAGTALVAVLYVAACAEPAPAPSPPPQPVPAAATIDAGALLPNGAEPFAGLITGGQPTLEQLDAASVQGIKTVINLRTPGESEIGQADVEARGMAYVAVPIAKDGLTAENAAVFAAAIEAAERPAIVHCGSGNRVGALFALKAFYDEQADIDAAVELGKTAGLTRMEAAVREHLAEPADDPVGPVVAEVSAPAPDPGLLLTIMSQLGEDMNALSDALWRDDMNAVAAAATAIADHPHISAAERERLQGTLGDRFPEFVQSDRRVHDSAARLAGLAASGEVDAALGELSELQTGCVACHESFQDLRQGSAPRAAP